LIVSNTRTNKSFALMDMTPSADKYGTELVLIMFTNY
jgi:hypothetical protein